MEPFTPPRTDTFALAFPPVRGKLPAAQEAVMGSLKAMDRRRMTPARARLVEAASRQRFALKELSAQLGRNPSYLQQYIAKGSPRVLPEDVRLALAGILGVAEDDLRDDTAPGMAGRPPGRMPAAEVAAAGGWPPSPSLSGRAVTLTMARGHGMIQPRDRVVCEPEQALRMGDLAAVVVAGEVQHVGLLTPAEGGRRAVMQDGPAVPVDDSAQVWRVVAVLVG